MTAAWHHLVGACWLDSSVAPQRQATLAREDAPQGTLDPGASRGNLKNPVEEGNRSRSGKGHTYRRGQ